MRTLIFGRGLTAPQLLQATLRPGDMVRIARKDDRYANGARRGGWVDAMDETVGEAGTVLHNPRELEGRSFLVETSTGKWYYTVGALERVVP